MTKEESFKLAPTASDAVRALHAKLTILSCPRCKVPLYIEEEGICYCNCCGIVNDSLNIKAKITFVAEIITKEERLKIKRKRKRSFLFFLRSWLIKHRKIFNL